MHIVSRYNHYEHLLSKIDARIKILAVLAILFMVLSYRGFAFPSVVALCCLALFVRMKVPARVIALRYAEPLFLAVMIILLKALFSGRDVLLAVDSPGFVIALHRDGLREGLLIGARIMSAVSVAAVLGFSTPFTEIMAGLSWFRVPRGFVEILLFAHRAIFTLFEDALVIYTAQKNRLGYSSLRRGLSSFGTLAGTLALKAFEGSQNTAIAMAQRGYDGSIPLLKHKPFRRSEVVVSVLVVCVMGALWTI